MNNVYIEKVNKWYPGGVHAVRDMDMEIIDGEFLVFVGPSGCGKTTLLRMIAGLEQITSGVIKIGGKVVNKVPPKNRDIAMVFQNYALYPTMSVFENIAFPLRMRKIRRKLIGGSVTTVSEKLGLEELLERRPGALSGGQRQRVALARAMVRSPRLFLMDEPLSNLDAKLRVNMRREIVSLQRDLGVTTVYVTHDQTEAMTMGTRIAVMKDGVLQQLDTPETIYSKPANLFTALFIGSPPMNVWDAEVRRGDNGVCFTFGNEVLPIDEGANISDEILNRKLVIGLRPEDVHIARDGAKPHISMRVDGIENTGREINVFLTAPGVPDLTMVTSSDFNGRHGDVIPIRLNIPQFNFFNSEDGASLL